MPGAKLGVERGSGERDHRSDDGLGGQDVPKEDNGAADDDYPLDHVAHAVGHGVDPSQGVEGKLVLKLTKRIRMRMSVGIQHKG